MIRLTSEQSIKLCGFKRNSTIFGFLGDERLHHCFKKKSFENINHCSVQNITVRRYG